MAARTQHLSLVEAVETLSRIADLEYDRDVGIAQKHEIVLGSEIISYKTVHWLHEKDAPTTVSLVRETFRVILHYLRNFYKTEYGHVTDPKALEGIKTIMVLVGEAAKKLDRYTKIFHNTQSVVELKEYQNLQDFYRTKIGPKIDEGALGKWVLDITLAKSPKSLAFRAAPKKAEKVTDTKHVFVDLETVKRDTEYELFFIRKEDGSRFFSTRLLRNIKLVCDFESFFGERKEDPLSNIKQWYDRILHNYSKEIIKTIGSRLDHFFREIRKIKDQELVEILNKALIALLLSSQSQNLLRNQPAKSCGEYFDDFLKFLRDALQTDIYQRWLSYPPKSSHHVAYDIIEMIRTISRALYSNLVGFQELKPIIQGLIQEANSQVSREHTQPAESSNLVWNRMASDYTAMSKLIKRHPNGPLFKIIEILEENVFHVFDSIQQHNLPNQLFDLYAQDKRYNFLRIPAPIYQEFINKAIVNDEFKEFIRNNSSGAVPRKHLLINFQDRTSWREHARCISLEELQKHPDFQYGLHVVTLANDTDFYYQLAPYHQVNQSDIFKEQFKELLLDEHAGYYFPPEINRIELESFIDKTMEHIHKLFFSSKNVLSRENRLDFIEIFYIFLELKLIELFQPDTISLTSKDSIDIGMSNSAAIFAFIKLITYQEWTEADWDHFNIMLYGPSILVRERIMLPERFNRVLSALRVVEHASHEFGPENFTKIVQEGFIRIFKTPILQSKILLPR